MRVSFLKPATIVVGDLALRREKGSALLIVLAFVVIIAIVLVAFLSNSRRALQQSESSSTILKTQMLGQVALAAIIDDLSDEMRAGADGTPEPGDLMQVSQPWAMVPSRVVKDPALLADEKFVNLVKQSVNKQQFFPGDGRATYSREGRARASSASTTVPSRNQRIISADRWNKPKLLGNSEGLANLSNEQLPDWVLITRSGVVEDGEAPGDFADKTTSNSSYVLGRFAYNIYRVDGLLDINVAGFDPDNAESGDAAAKKGSLAFADLRAIPGLEDDAASQSIVDWRNKVSKSSYTKMVAGLKSTSLSNTTPENWGEPGGFLQPYTDGGSTDNQFFSRQDLLNYFDHAFGRDSAQSLALPYLTTFSADLNQPSFRPDPARPKVMRSAVGGGNDAYGNESLPAYQQINPPVLSVLDGAGQPIVKRRFPLDRLKYVYPGPGDPEKVADYFGLIWNSATQTWDYVDGDEIKRLHEIQNREPNMIELLKAAIATGSLGGQLPNAGEHSDSPRAVGRRDSFVNYHVMRIAANIIDQYDSDSYPTRISFGDFTVCGTENLPYIYGFRVAPYRQVRLDMTSDVEERSGYTKPSDASGGLYRSVVMIQPIIWNPHAPPATTPDLPPRFRITASSPTDVRPVARRPWWIPAASRAYAGDWPSKTGDTRDLNSPVGFFPERDYITFSVLPGDLAKASFREPYTLKAPDYPPGSGALAYDSTGEFFEQTLGANEQNDSTQPDESSDRVIGFRAGWSWGGPWASGGSTTNPTWLQEGRLETSGIDFELQYQTSSGQWVTYDSFEKLIPVDPYRLDRLTSGAGYINPRYMRYFMRTDPRVDRYGARSFLEVAKVDGTGGMPQGRSVRPGSDAGAVATAGWPDSGTDYNFTIPASTARFFGQLSENKASSDVHYQDPDGVQRLAMGGYSVGVNGLPLALQNVNSRPVILNRPFRSVVELGNVLRDQPWKQLDFFSPESGDATLLDMFCVYEPEDETAEPVVAGRVNLNTPHFEVIEAMLRGVELQEGSGSLLDSIAETQARSLVAWTSSADDNKGPLRNRSELLGKFTGGTAYSGVSSVMGGDLSSTDRSIPYRRQNALRALVDAGSTRNWSFLIDLIVQDGQFSKTGADPGDFNVRGEKRYWVHLTMDRFTGKVVMERIEEVHE